MIRFGLFAVVGIDIVAAVAQHEHEIAGRVKIGIGQVAPQKLAIAPGDEP